MAARGRAAIALGADLNASGLYLTAATARASSADDPDAMLS
jgi:hypothetical protein